LLTVSRETVQQKEAAYENKGIITGPGAITGPQSGDITHIEGELAQAKVRVVSLCRNLYFVNNALLDISLSHELPIDKEAVISFVHSCGSMINFTTLCVIERSIDLNIVIHPSKTGYIMGTPMPGGWRISLVHNNVRSLSQTVV